MGVCSLDWSSTHRWSTNTDDEGHGQGLVWTGAKWAKKKTCQARGKNGATSVVMVLIFLLGRSDKMSRLTKANFSPGTPSPVRSPAPAVMASSSAPGLGRSAPNKQGKDLRVLFGFEVAKE